MCNMYLVLISFRLYYYYLYYYYYCAHTFYFFVCSGLLVVWVLFLGRDLRVKLYL